MKYSFSSSLLHFTGIHIWEKKKVAKQFYRDKVVEVICFIGATAGGGRYPLLNFMDVKKSSVTLESSYLPPPVLGPIKKFIT